MLITNDGQINLVKAALRVVRKWKSVKRKFKEDNKYKEAETVKDIVF